MAEQIFTYVRVGNSSPQFCPLRPRCRCSRGSFSGSCQTLSKRNPSNVIFPGYSLKGCFSFQVTGLTEQSVAVARTWSSPANSRPRPGQCEDGPGQHPRQQTVLGCLSVRQEWSQSPVCLTHWVRGLPQNVSHPEHTLPRQATLPHSSMFPTLL